MLPSANPYFGLWAVLFSFFAVQGFFLTGVLFFLKKGRPVANRFLAALAFLIAIITSGYVVETSSLSHVLPSSAFLIGPFWLLLGPVLFGYMWLLTGHTVRLSWVTLLQLLPFLVYLIPTLHRALFLEHFREAGYWHYLYLAQDGSIGLVALLYTYLFTIQMFSYAILCVRLLLRYEKAYRDNAADGRAAYLQWLRRLVTVLVGYLAFETVFSVILLVNRSVESHYYYLSALLISSFLLLIVYTAIRDPHVFLPSLPERNKKYHRSSLPEPYVEHQLAKLMALMEQQKPHLRNDLKLQDLAELLGISRHHVTQLLNQQVGKTFHAFINAYRIEEVRQRLCDPLYREYTVLAIAHDVGFNSKTTFNRIFKQHTQMTPSQFAKIHAVEGRSA